MDNNSYPVEHSPGNPNEEQSVQPNRPDTEINPGEVGTNTEVDLDTQKTKTYPEENPPGQH